MAGLLGTARRVTATLQNGSLPIYLVVILLTAVVVPGAALATAPSLPDGLVAGESWIQLTIAGTAALAAAALVAVRNRLGAVLMLGVVGYGMAGLFALQGAPDLALTQVLVETVTLVVFAIVLARLPEQFSAARRPPVGRVLRGVVALGVGAFAAAGALAAAAARTAAPISSAYLERSQPEGGGRNVVNVILTDFRALDTFGEIAVVATAAIGVAGLVAGLPRRSGERS
jgi:multicomponent Na+:H+ antiporter subunit A